MRRLALRLVWRLGGRRLGWMALAAAARTLVRGGSTRRVDRATADLEQRLPPSVGEALATLPGDPLRMGGRALAAHRSARSVAAGAGRASRAANEGRRRVGRGVGAAADLVAARPRPVRGGRRLLDLVGRQVRAETAESQRRLRARMLDHSRGRAASDEALLDVRSGAGLDVRSGAGLDVRSEAGLDVGSGAGFDVRSEAGFDVGPDVQLDLRTDRSQGGIEPGPPAPVAPGRLRAPRRRAQATVDRVQRSYRPPRRPWDR